jgi:hypothetical protein
MTWQHTAASCRFSEPIRVPVNHPRYGQNKIHTPWTERLIGASSNYCTFWWPLITSNFVQALASCRNWLVIKHTSLFMKILPMFVASAGREGRAGFKLHTSLQLWWSGARWCSPFTAPTVAPFSTWSDTAMQQMSGINKYICTSCLASCTMRNNTDVSEFFDSCVLLNYSAFGKSLCA